MCLPRKPYLLECSFLWRVDPLSSFSMLSYAWDDMILFQMHTLYPQGINIVTIDIRYMLRQWSTVH